MAIQVGGTTVIDNTPNLVNVGGLKTVGGVSILGSGDISVGGDAVRAIGVVVNAGMETLGSSSYARLYIDKFNYRYGRTLTWTGSGDGAFFSTPQGNGTGRAILAPTSATMTTNYSDATDYDCYFYLGAGRGMSTTQGASQMPHFYGIYLEFPNT